MKKIMFNDKYGLTKAVLEGRKTQTRRIGYQVTFKRYCNCGFCLEGADKNKLFINDGNEVVAKSNFKIGEEVAIAQRYIDLDDKFYRLLGIYKGGMKGYRNKMFAKADLMPHRIRITNIRVERLQDISEEDCRQKASRIPWAKRTQGRIFIASRKQTPATLHQESHTPSSSTRYREKAHGKETHSFLFTSSNLSNSRAMEERKYKIQQTAIGMQDTQGSTWINAWNKYGAASLSDVPGRK